LRALSLHDFLAPFGILFFVQKQISEPADIKEKVRDKKAKDLELNSVEDVSNSDIF
jgi:hypothetical protein